MNPLMNKRTGWCHKFMAHRIINNWENIKNNEIQSNQVYDKTSKLRLRLTIINHVESFERYCARDRREEI